MHKNLENSSADLQRRDSKHIWHPFSSLVPAMPVLPVVKGEGVWLYTEDGRKILDGVSSWWVNLHGHANQHIAQAIAKQAQTLEHVIFAGFTHPGAIQLAERLLPLLTGQQELLFFSDNGSTAVEVALKMSLQYWYNHQKPRYKIIALEGAYHGDTFGAMSVGERGGFNMPFEEHLFEVAFVPFPEKEKESDTINAFRKILEKEAVAAFIFEPLVQGSAGMRMYAPEVLDTLIKLAHAAGVLCIADEVMTGFGRTGELFACNYLQEAPDLVCLSKGITGGFMPLGVTACTEAVASAFRQADPAKTFYHGHSYTANPLACAAALASLDLLLAEPCKAQLQMIGGQHLLFMEKIGQHAAVKEVRSRGTILAIELKTAEGTSYHNTRRNELYQYFLDRNILLRPLGNVLYLMPPYVISREELQGVYAAVEGLLDSWAEN
ncbi:adenosylmethionine--8-amino-7-oxononanoate transaminase [Cesiribacter sp. SM1]|uniref:adenosylmethionine--8-amino-7-oxononanoate transaminase n=1 Tax=Cesiribacter sp. SM1 TaxID=2861196 RepID=UPI001CD6EB4E|nr:adenosylmethionine--8-amino-7-oxononanoate transaminase [Cesiribacter sp. SM1]